MARDKFHLTAGLATVDDLTTAQLHQLMITLNARRAKKSKTSAPFQTPHELANSPF